MRKPLCTPAHIAFTAAICLCGSLAVTSCGLIDGSDPAPQLRYKPAAEGCGNFLVYKWTDDGKEAIVIEAIADRLGLSTRSRTFRLDSITSNSLGVRLNLYTRPAENDYCSDVRVGNPETPTVWTAISGTATITLDRDSVAVNDIYHATVILENVVFSNGQSQVTLNSETFNNVVVGWLPG